MMSRGLILCWSVSLASGSPIKQLVGKSDGKSTEEAPVEGRGPPQLKRFLDHVSEFEAAGDPSAAAAEKALDKLVKSDGVKQIGSILNAD